MLTIIDREAEGITQKSLKTLRNILCENFRRPLIIVQVTITNPNPLALSDLCGFLIIIPGQGAAYWSGEGFRTDNAGEGGRGYDAAVRMFSLFGVPIHFYLDAEMKPTHGPEEYFDELGRTLGLLADALMEERVATEASLSIIADRNPSY